MVKTKDYTSIGVSKDVKKKLQNLKEYPRETDNEVLIKLIKGELSGSNTQQPSYSK